jgi:hypothetical protein
LGLFRRPREGRKEFGCVIQEDNGLKGLDSAQTIKKIFFSKLLENFLVCSPRGQCFLGPDGLPTIKEFLAGREKGFLIDGTGNCIKKR